MKTEKLCQVITCTCGADFAACNEPHCYTDKDWLKDLRRYAKKGYNIKTIPTKGLNMQQCRCKQESEELKNQLQLF